MNYSEKVEKTVEFADLRNKVQSVLDYVSTETTELQDKKKYAIKKNHPMYHQDINNNIKQNYVIESTLLAIRRDIENMHDDIKTNVEQEKNALSHGDQTEDNA